MLCEAAGFRTGSRWQEEEQQGAEKNSMKKRHLVTRGLAVAMAAVFLTAAAPVYAEDGTGTSGAGTTQSVQDSGETPSGAVESAGTSSGIKDGNGSGTVAQSGSTGAESGSVSVTPDASEPSAAPQADAAGADDPVKSSSSAQEGTPEVSEEAEQEKELPHMDVLYSAHVQNIGWMGEVSNGAEGGTNGRSLRMEALKIRLSGQADLHVHYQAHVQNIGWMGEVSDGALAGTEGRSLRMEALKLRLTGNDADKYTIWYRVHAQNIGWMGWAKNGETAGTTGQSLRLEAIQIRILPNTEAAPANDGSTSVPAYDASVSIQAHVQNIGWMGWASGTAGTTGRSLRMEAVRIGLNGGSVSGGIEYRTHIQNIGWESGWAANGSTSGTEGRSLRLEAVQLRLTGDIANYYDVYYRAHIQNYGWLGWTCNGQSAGSSGCSYRMEALQVQLRIKGSGAPGSTANAFVKDQIRLNVPCVMQFPELPTGCESVALTNLLLYHGFRLGKTTIADNYLPYGSNYAVSFVGNPHSVNGAGVYPPGIVIAANRYLAAKGSSLRAYDITGSSMEQLYSYLDQGYPVLVWSTTGMASPYVTGHQSYGGRTYPWFSQEHCVVLKGYNRRTNTVYVSDSISGDLGRNASRFTDLYNQIGRFAAVIR
ncbi:MAG: C39 family peptidase [Lachnospiraceae bacterium]|nr:C39 family peptidase [Lachnospiraceae bacterium]